MIVAGNFAFGLVECILSVMSSLTIEPQHNERFISLLDQHLPIDEYTGKRRNSARLRIVLGAIDSKTSLVLLAPDLSLTNCFTRGVIPTPLMECSA